MAESVIQKGKTLKELEKEITCSVCQEHYTEPKVLPCLHYYCKECVLRLALRTASNKPFSCPECRKETTLRGRCRGTQNCLVRYDCHQLAPIVCQLTPICTFGHIWPPLQPNPTTTFLLTSTSSPDPLLPR